MSKNGHEIWFVYTSPPKREDSSGKRSDQFIPMFNELVNSFEKDKIDYSNIIVGDINFHLEFMDGEVIGMKKTTTIFTKCFNNIELF